MINTIQLFNVNHNLPVNKIIFIMEIKMFIVIILGNSRLGLCVYPIHNFHVLLVYFCTKSV